jgi:hypothetical protein
MYTTENKKQNKKAHSSTASNSDGTIPTFSSAKSLASRDGSPFFFTDE